MMVGEGRNVELPIWQHLTLKETVHSVSGKVECCHTAFTIFSTTYLCSNYKLSNSTQYCQHDIHYTACAILLYATGTQMIRGRWVY